MNSSALESRDQGLEITILVTCDVSNVQSSNGFATCFRLVCDPLAQVCDQVFDLLDWWNLALSSLPGLP